MSDRAERIAMAVILGNVPMSDAREDLHLALREREVERNANALRTYRTGGDVWVWPSVAPWVGF